MDSDGVNREKMDGCERMKKDGGSGWGKRYL